MTASRKVQYLNPGRAQKLNCFIFNDYLQNLDNNGRSRSNKQTGVHL